MKKTLGCSKLNPDLNDDKINPLLRHLEINQYIYMIISSMKPISAATTQNMRSQNLGRTWTGKVKVEMENDRRIKTSSKSDSPTNSRR